MVWSWNHDFKYLSDERVKKNVSELNIGLDFIRLLNPVQWQWKMSDEHPRQHYGVTVQNIEEALETLEVDDSCLINIPDYHNLTEEEREAKPKYVSQNSLIGLLISSIKQLDEKVQELEKKLEEK
jgi:hypothetical protein